MGYEVIFDIETQNTFADVNNDFRKLKVSVVSICLTDSGQLRSFEEGQLGELWPILEKSDRIVGYNSEHFDLPILGNYYLGDLTHLPHLDIMKCVKEALGFRLKLADLAEATLDNVSKSADGLQAVRWWREGKLEEIKKYCEQDVLVTKQLYDFGLQHRQLFYKTLTGEVSPFAVNFDPVVKPNAPKINLSLPF